MDIVKKAAQAFGNNPALITDKRTISFVELVNKTARIASAFAAEGITAGNVIALVSPNSTSMVLALMALLRTDAIAAPLNYRFPPTQIEEMLQRLPLAMTLDAKALGRFVRTALIRKKAAFTPARTLKRPVSIIHTSASSGNPKAAMHTLANHWYSAKGAAENLPFVPGDCWLLSLPLYHVGGYSMLFKCLSGGGALALPSPDKSLAKSLDHFPVTHLSLVPTQLYRILRTPGGADRLRRLKAVLLGGSAAPAPLLEEAIREKIPVYLTYGSTEMSTQISTSPAPITSVQGDSGVLLPYREACVAPDGELLVRGECLFIGYLQETGSIRSCATKGWHHTGDLGSISPEGVVTVHGRKDNMFISGGENIHPEEIERALCSIEGIEEAVVVPSPDAEYGMRPVAWIMVQEHGGPDDATLIKSLKVALGTLKTPVRFTRERSLVTIPGSSKIDRRWYMELARSEKK